MKNYSILLLFVLCSTLQRVKNDETQNQVSGKITGETETSGNGKKTVMQELSERLNGVNMVSL